MQTIIHRATSEDAQAVADLCREHASYEALAAPPVDQIERLQIAIAQQDVVVWVAIVAGDVAAYLSATTDYATLSGHHYLHMDCLFVREGWRGKGIGAMLMDEAKRYAQQCHYVEMQWQTPEWNADAARFYQRVGAHRLAKWRFTLRI